MTEGRSQMRAIPTVDGISVMLIKGKWRARVSLADFPGWVQMYRGFRDREGGKFAQFYVQSVEAMEATAKKLGIVIADRPKPKGARK